MRGYYTPYIPGWDNHGMPIESAIIKEQKLNHKAMSVADFRSACHAYADHYIDVQREGFKRMGVIGDWEHPYKTMDPGLRGRWKSRVFGKMYKNGHIYKGLKPVYWCAHDETALAEAEIEYQGRSLHHRLRQVPHARRSGQARQSGQVQALLRHLDYYHLDPARQPCHRTAPGRRAYVIVKAPNGEMYIMAEALTEKVMKIWAALTDYEIVETSSQGAFFENMLAAPPLPAQDQPPCSGRLRHHGLRYRLRPHRSRLRRGRLRQTCKRYGMDMVVPVDDQGKPHRIRRQVRRTEAPTNATPSSSTT